MAGQIPLPDETLLHKGTYKIESHLGTGGFGITYRVQDTKLNRVVAIKEFFPDGCRRRGKKLVADGDWEEEFLAELKNSFLEECRILATLKHPGIVSVRKFFGENDTFYMVMEFIEGQTLFQYLRSHQNAPPIEETLAIIQEAGEALMVVHKAGLLHRDLKPPNIMRRTNGQIVLIDFGAARDMERTHTPIGTDGYIPLEQLEGQSEWGPGPYTDVYALSATLYKLLTGMTPTDARSRNLVPLASPRDLRPDIPEAVSEAILYGLKLKAEERPQTVQAFLEALFPPPPSPLIAEPEYEELSGYDVEAPVPRFVVAEPNVEKVSYHLSPNDWGVPRDWEEGAVSSPPTKINPIDGAEMILIPAGAFLMGDEDQSDNPRRTVTLDDYYIYKTPVTVGEYWKYCEATGKQMPLAPSWGWRNNHPMVNVTWEDAKAYCDWAGVSLPTEAQWEKTARGTDGRRYPWGEAWDRKRCADFGGDINLGDTVAVGSFPLGTSPYGVMDMVGHVWEWCEDWCDAFYYQTAPSYNPLGPFFSPTGCRVVRGGDFYADAPSDFRCSVREGAHPAYGEDYIGFRCASSANSY